MQDRPHIGIAGADAATAALLEKTVIRLEGHPVVLASNRLDLDGLGGLVVAGAGGCVAGAIDRGLPVLCVGHGMFALNSAFGGASPAEAPGHDVEDVEDKDGEPVSAYHRIYIAPGSKLAAIVGSGGFVRVNSRHGVGLREAQKSPRLLASAYGLDDGVIEALESPEHDWVIGVQFKPERRMELPPHFDRLFQGLVERAAR